MFFFFSPDLFQYNFSATIIFCTDAFLFHPFSESELFIPIFSLQFFSFVSRYPSFPATIFFSRLVPFPTLFRLEIIFHLNFLHKIFHRYLSSPIFLIRTRIIIIFHANFFTDILFFPTLIQIRTFHINFTVTILK